MNETETIPIDAYVVAFNETRHYCIDDEDKPYIERINGVYLFDRNEVTYCCELTPSYWLRHIYDDVVLAIDTPDDLRDKLQQKYGYEGGDDRYVHYYVVDQMIDEPKSGSVYHYGDPGVSFDDVTREEQMEALEEHFNANHYV